jgi:hypothetical protein
MVVDELQSEIWFTTIVSAFYCKTISLAKAMNLGKAPGLLFHACELIIMSSIVADLQKEVSWRVV